MTFDFFEDSFSSIPTGPALMQVLIILFGLKKDLLPSAFIMIIFWVMIFRFLEEINLLL